MMSAIRIVILGDRKVGKSAITVRFLTRRFIGEYSSDIDLFYRSSCRLDDIMTEIEVLDTCTKSGQKVAVDETRTSWADACVIVYSILDRSSFYTARALIESIIRLRSSTCISMLLLGNMTDIDHRREVAIQEGHQMAQEFGCQYSEVSAAESNIEITSAFHTFLREVKLIQNQRNSPFKRRKSSLSIMSKRLGAMFGKKDSNSNNSLEIASPVRGSNETKDVTKL